MTVLEFGDAQVLSPGQVARVLGVDPSTVRRWVRDGAVPNVFADLPTDRLGIPTWWLADRISPEGPATSTGERDGADTGRHLRAVGGR